LTFVTHDVKCSLTSAKVIWQTATSLFHHIRQVAVLNTKLLVGGEFATPFWHLGDEEIVGGQRYYHSKEQCVSYRLSIVTTALSLIIRSQFANEY